MTPADTLREALELLPCPFCGSPARTDLLPHSGGPGWVQCSSCECDQHMSDTLDEAVARWNTRAASEPVAGTDDLRQVLGFLNSIEGAGYGGMAEFEIARETVRRVSALSAPAPTGRDLRDIGILLSALRNLEDAVGEDYEDEDGTIAQIEADYLAGVVRANEGSAVPPHAGATTASAPVEIRRNPDNSIDEIAAHRCNVHIEQMCGHGWFMSLDPPDGSQWRFWFGASNQKSLVVFRHDETVPAATPPAPGAADRAAVIEAKAYVERAIASYAGDPADNQFQKGFLAALEVVRDEAFSTPTYAPSTPRPENCATADPVCHFPSCVCVDVKGNIIDPYAVSRADGGAK